MKSRTKKKDEKLAGIVMVSVKMTPEERERIKNQGAKEQRNVSAEIRYQMNRAYGAAAPA